MADNWDDESDDDWDVSDDDLDRRLQQQLGVNGGPNFDDEVDLAVKEKAAAEAFAQQENKKKGKALADKKAAEAARKEEEEIARRAVELEAEAESNMTAEERKLHERRRVEEADSALADDVFGGGGGVSAKGTATASPGAGEALVLKDLKDHLKHARKLSTIFRGHGKVHFTTSFFKECITQSSNVLDEDAISELIKQLNVLKNEKVQAAKRKVKGQAQKSKKQDKHAAAQARKIHDQTFGDNDKFDAYDEIGEDYEDAFF